MSINVKFFASLRERVGQGEASLDFMEQMNVAQVWDQATTNMARPNNTLCAINMEYVNMDNIVDDGDEVAFFPPVTGG
jgi:molybdopterin synthase sulfur carrier subunit